MNDVTDLLHDLRKTLDDMERQHVALAHAGGNNDQAHTDAGAALEAGAHMLVTLAEHLLFTLASDQEQAKG